MKQTPFWVEDHPRPEGLTTDLPDQTDYLVIGSGLTGLTAALRLTHAGKTVTVGRGLGTNIAKPGDEPTDPAPWKAPRIKAALASVR